MALPASGPISLNEMHIEAGGATGTLCTINDTDIRGLIGKASAVSMNFAEWYGASAESIVWAGESVSGYGAFGTIDAWHYMDNDGGTREDGTPGSVTDRPDWCDSHPSTNGADYEMRTGTISDTGGGGNFSPSYASNTTYNLGTSDSVRVYLTVNGWRYVTIPIIVREDGGSGGTSYNLILDVTREPF